MAQTCGQCSRVNPPDAAFCYFDGSALPGTARNGGPVAAGQRRFPSAFIFPGGRSCRTFDELAVCCQEEWPAARDLLKQGYFESFLSGLGRADLAVAARQAARFPDPDRGLDLLLTRLPTGVLEAPKLLVDPQEVSLGQVHVGEDRSFELHLENRGMRLLYGSVSCEDCNWLVLGGSKGASEKHFQFGAETVIPVHVQGTRLRAGRKPLEGKLVVDSNGGTVTVVVRTDVPVKPFAEGVLAGARSPRQIAEKAKLKPVDAAELFENGAVARWYKENGWSYPVTAPGAKGPAAVQQFFEVLGLTIPPKVEISEKSVALRGNVGDTVRHELLVSNHEKKAKPVFAHAISNQAWLEVGRAKLNGRTAAIPLAIPAVPDREGETLTARVVVIANGNQRFVVPVALEVGGNLRFGNAPPLSESGPALSLDSADSPIRTKATRAHGLSTLSRILGVGRLAWPALLLVMLLCGVLYYDAFQHEEPDTGLLDPEPRLLAHYNDSMRFGITMLKEPDPTQPGKYKRLTYDERGATHNTCIKIDDQDLLFGFVGPSSWWARDPKKGEIRRFDPKTGDSRAEWETKSSISVTQTVRLVPGEQTRVLDTYLIRYTIENKSNDGHKVGLRAMLDTFIGANDGSPFVIPGQAGLLDTMRVFSQKEIPDYVEALEHPDLLNPGTVAHLGLKGLRAPDSRALEPILEMRICHWPRYSEVRWDWDLEPINKDPEKKDSCVALYWAYQDMNPGEVRELGFTYGLNSVSSGDGQIGLSVGGSFKPDGEFTVTAYIKDSKPGQKVKLDLPSGLALLQGESAEKDVEKGAEFSQVSWRLRAKSVGLFRATVTSGLVREACSVRITEKGMLD
jgi:hypothetical protein